MGPKESLEGEEEDGEIKASIQAQMADMLGGENGEKKTLPKLCTLELTGVARMNEGEGEKG